MYAPKDKVQVFFGLHWQKKNHSQCAISHGVLMCLMISLDALTHLPWTLHVHSICLNDW
jgi:hypothetical protein